MPGKQITTGSCLCKAIAYDIETEAEHEIKGVLCHCTHCQVSGGGLGSYNAVFPLDSFKVTSETQLGSFEDTGDSGNKVNRCFCPKCGTAIITMDKKNKVGYVKIPSFSQPLEDSSTIKPSIEIFTSSKNKWEPKQYCEDVDQAERSP